MQDRNIHARYGLCLALSADSEEFRCFIDSFSEFNKLDGDDVCDVNVYNIHEYSDELGMGFVNFFGDKASGKKFRKVYELFGDESDMGDALVFWADKGTSPFMAKYTEESLVEEFREKIGKYMPDSFDYRSHIGWFSCCLYNDRNPVCKSRSSPLAREE